MEEDGWSGLKWNKVVWNINVYNKIRYPFYWLDTLMIEWNIILYLDSEQT